MTRLTVAPDAEGAARAAADLLARHLEEARSARGQVHLALAGGSSPRRTYELLPERLSSWEGVELWFGDERAVAPDDPESNYAMVARSLLSRARIPPARVHRIAGERDAREAAALYAAELRDRLPRDPELRDRLPRDPELRGRLPPDPAGLPTLDVALLGLGEDGHTASLFPGGAGLENRGELCVAVYDAPKPPPVRITLTLEALRAARAIVVLATGAQKAWAAAAVLAEADEERVEPAGRLGGPRTELIVDSAARPVPPATQTRGTTGQRVVRGKSAVAERAR